MRHIVIAIALLWGISATAANYIVMFKQQEVAISSLEHDAYQSVLQDANKKSVTQLQGWLGAHNLRAKVDDLWLIRGAVVDLDDAGALRLGKEPWVDGIYADKVRQYITPASDVVVANSLAELGETGQTLWGLQRIGLPRIRSEFPGLTGAGVRVGILDTGIQSKHPELGDKNVVFKDFVNHIAYPYDDHGHGTHVAGTIAGKQVGIAPRASIVFGKIFGAGGSGSDSTLLMGMQWMFNPSGNAGANDYPQIVSNSWGGDLDGDGPHDIAQFTPFRTAIQAWIHGGIVPVFAAGNSGKHPNGFPGGLPEPLAVGALDTNDKIAEFSSRGPNLWRIGELVLTLLKPDITAPGVKITSSFPGNKYAQMDGTSMATPHVSGAIALALQANRKLKFADVKTLLLKSSEKKMDVSFGYGVMNAYSFVKAAMGREPLAP